MGLCKMVSATWDDIPMWPQEHLSPIAALSGGKAYKVHAHTLERTHTNTRTHSDSHTDAPACTLTTLTCMHRHTTCTCAPLHMYRDIVPRAFGCDYALVADLLKQWLPSFKTHPPLQGDYKSLYKFLGGVAVLQ